jgi:hypothetical protein
VELFDFVVVLVLRFAPDFVVAAFRFVAVVLRFAAVVFRFAAVVFRFAAVVFRFAAVVFRFDVAVFRFAAVLLALFRLLVFLVLLALVLLFARVFFVVLFRDVLLVLVFVFVREPVVRVFAERDERRVVRKSSPGAGSAPSWPSSSPPSPPPRSFFATTAAAGTARPIAVPATTFVGVDSPCSSCSSSSFDMVASLGAPAVELGDLARRYFASLNPSMNFGTIRSRTISGPCFARYLPAASAASSAIGSSASAAASQLVAAADASIDGELAPFPFGDEEPPSSRSSPFDLPPSCERIRLTAYVAAPVAAAAAAAFNAALATPPPPFVLIFSCSATDIGQPLPFAQDDDPGFD